MANVQIDFFSPAICRISSVQLVLPNDANEDMVKNNPHYQRPVKTLFLLHGYSGACRDWLNASLVTELALKYNLAVVMPSADNSFYVNGKASGYQYEDFIVKDLRSYLQKTFSLAMNAEDTFIGGLSMGGFGALRLGIAHPECFAKTVGLSSALIIEDIKNMTEDSPAAKVANKAYYEQTFGDLTKLEESPVNPEYLIEESLRKKEKLIPIFMACGSEDFLIENNRHFHEFLLKKGIDHVYKESAGIHDWKFWNEYLEPAIRWFLES